MRNEMLSIIVGAIGLVFVAVALGMVDFRLGLGAAGGALVVIAERRFAPDRRETE